MRRPPWSAVTAVGSAGADAGAIVWRSGPIFPSACRRAQFRGGDRRGAGAGTGFAAGLSPPGQSAPALADDRRLPPLSPLLLRLRPLRSPPADARALAALLSERRNDLTEAALELLPEIAEILAALGESPGCCWPACRAAARPVFGLFESAPRRCDRGRHPAGRRAPLVGARDRDRFRSVSVAAIA